MVFTIVPKCELSDPKINPERKNLFLINEIYAELASELAPGQNIKCDSSGRWEQPQWAMLNLWLRSFFVI